jgi:hypothetical protein
MTAKQSTARLVLYVLIAMVTSASAGLQTVNFSNIQEVSGFALGILATGLVTARSYIDQSPNQVSISDKTTN